MTESEFLALKPRERDAVVAKRVMGFCPHDSSMVEPDTFRGEVSYYWCCWCFDRRPSRHAFDQPRYTTDISAAWQVVGKMREEGWTGYVEWVPGFGFGAEFSRGDSNLPGPGFEWGDSPIMIPERTAPLAIAIAALKAKGVIE